MPEALECPACGPGHPLSHVDPHLSYDVRLLRCSACLGLLADRESVMAASEHYGPTHPIMAVRTSSHRCRSCQLIARPGDTVCVQCHQPLRLRCSRCSRQMRMLEVVGVVIDLCHPCEIVFFDRGELAQITRDPIALARALRPKEQRAGKNLAVDAASPASVDAVALVEPVELLAHGADAAAEAALHASGAAAEGLASANLAAVAETATEVAAGAGEVAGAAAEMVLELVAGIFSGL
ncbi:MAG: zf-TFIIB domain-containing protein [Myxococcales bacterium]|nr:zf-TFIIB domain-containing protein [Myxococcales bacterium]